MIVRDIKERGQLNLAPSGVGYLFSYSLNVNFVILKAGGHELSIEKLQN